MRGEGKRAKHRFESARLWADEGAGVVSFQFTLLPQLTAVVPTCFYC